MKTLLKVYIWIMYIVALPVFLVFSTIALVYYSIKDYKCTGEWAFIEALKVYCEGCMTGHKINMARIEDVFADEGYKEEGV